jgi:hypothetical protein
MRQWQQLCRQSRHRPAGNGRLFRICGRRPGRPHRIQQQEAYAITQRRVRAAGIETRICNYTSGAMGITVLIENFVTLEETKHIASYSSPRKSKLYNAECRRAHPQFDEVLWGFQ